MTSARRRRTVVLINEDGRHCDALEWALADVRPSSDELFLLRTFRPLDLPECWWAPVSRRNDDLRLAARTALSRAMRSVRTAVAPVHVSASCVPREPEDALAALSTVADRIVVAATDLRVPQLRTLLRRVRCPLVVLPSEPPVASGRDGSIALELDRPLLPEATTGFAFDEARRRCAGLVVTLSWALGLPGDPADRAEQLAWQTEQQTGLDAALAGWRDRYPEVPVTVALRQESPYTSLRRLGDAAQLVVVPRWSGGALPLPTLALIRQRCAVAIVPESVPLASASRAPAVALAG